MYCLVGCDDVVCYEVCEGDGVDVDVLGVGVVGFVGIFVDVVGVVGDDNEIDIVVVVDWDFDVVDCCCVGVVVGVEG